MLCNRSPFRWVARAEHAGALEQVLRPARRIALEYGACGFCGASITDSSSLLRKGRIGRLLIWRGQTGWTTWTKQSFMMVGRSIFRHRCLPGWVCVVEHDIAIGASLYNRRLKLRHVTGWTHFQASINLLFGNEYFHGNGFPPNTMLAKQPLQSNTPSNPAALTVPVIMPEPLLHVNIGSVVC